MKFEYPSELPVSAARSDIAEAVRSSQVVIVSGQTGSGKTTQLPKILLELGRGSHGRQIVHTQPRRLATRTVVFCWRRSNAIRSSCSTTRSSSTRRMSAV